VKPGRLLKGRIVSGEWAGEDTLVTYRVPGHLVLEIHDALILVLGDYLCPYHQESLGWDECSEGYDGRCAVRALRQELYRTYKLPEPISYGPPDYVKAGDRAMIPCPSCSKPREAVLSLDGDGCFEFEVGAACPHCGHPGDEEED